MFTATYEYFGITRKIIKIIFSAKQLFGWQSSHRLVIFSDNMSKIFYLILAVSIILNLTIFSIFTVLKIFTFSTIISLITTILSAINWLFNHGSVRQGVQPQFIFISRQFEYSRYYYGVFNVYYYAI
jgi:membrane protein required for beta-lactamase induction